MNKSKIYLDLSKCTEEEQKHVFTLLPDPILSDDYDIRGKYKYLLITDDYDNYCNKWYVDFCYDDRTELTYPEFIKLFEGGESKEDFAIYKRTFNKIPYPRVEWECNCGFKHCLNEGFEQDYRKDNFKEIRLPTGNCLKCKKEIKTHSLESKEVLQVENTVFNIDFGGHVMAGLKIINGEIEVVGAMNGYGNGISTDEIRITKSNQ